MLRIRGYRDADLPACRLLWTQLVEQHRRIYKDDTIGGRNPGIAFDRHRDKIGKAHLFVAESEGKVVGLAGLMLRDGEAEIDPIVVLKERRRQGVGTALVERMRKLAAGKKVDYLCIRRPDFRPAYAGVEARRSTSRKKANARTVAAATAAAPAAKGRPGSAS